MGTTVRTKLTKCGSGSRTMGGNRYVQSWSVSCKAEAFFAGPLLRHSLSKWYVRTVRQSCSSQFCELLALCSICTVGCYSSLAVSWFITNYRACVSGSLAFFFSWWCFMLGHFDGFRRVCWHSLGNAVLGNTYYLLTGPTSQCQS